MTLRESFISENIYIPGLEMPGEPPEKNDRKAPDNNFQRYTDAEVAELPDIAPDHPHYQEWSHRQRSSRKLVQRLVARNKNLSILEVGAGNGWLSHQLSLIPGSRVVGLDLNFSELSQAARIFRGQPNLKFIYGDFCSDVLHGLYFDIIVFAASIQYFDAFPAALRAALTQLRAGGEIHVLNSFLNTRELSSFHYRLLYNPHSVWNKLLRKHRPFPWLVIYGHG